MSRRKPRQPKPHTRHSAPPSKPKRPSLEIEALEPRILLSATWTGTEGDDTHNAGNQGDELHGLGGHDTLNGGTGRDIIDGGAGDDHLYGDQGNDDLFSGGGNDYMDGGVGSDTFHFDGAQHGDSITVVGGNGSDTLDLSGYHNNQLHESGSTVTVDLGGGQSFTINHSEVETIHTADGDYAPGAVPVNHAPTADDGSLSLSEDGSAAVTLHGTDPDAGDAVDHYVIDSTPDHGTLLLNGSAVHAGDSVSQADIDAGHLTFQAESGWHGDTSIGFHAHDGDALSANAGAFGIHVDAATPPSVVNHAPTADDGSMHLNEGLAGTIHLSGTDPDAGDAVDHYVIDSTPDHGTLLLNGSAVHTGDSVSQADIDAGHLTFQAEAGWHGDTSIGFHAHDGDAFSTNAGTFDIHVDPLASAVDGGGHGTAPGGPTPPVVTPSDPVAVAPTDPGGHTDGDPTVVTEPPTGPEAAVPSEPTPSTPPSAPGDVVSNDPHPVADPVGGSTGLDAFQPAPTPAAPSLNLGSPGLVQVEHLDLGAGSQPHTGPGVGDVVNLPPQVAPHMSGPTPLGSSQTAPTALGETNTTGDHDNPSISAPSSSSESDHHRVIWSDHEDMQVLDPHAGFTDFAHESADRVAASSESAAHDDPVPISSAIESHFSITQVVTIPTLTMTGSAAESAPSAAAGGSVRDQFVVDDDPTAAHRWATRFSDDAASLGSSWLDDHHDDPVGSSADSDESAHAELGGFFARLWGTVSGFARTGSRSETDERDSKRG